MSRTMEKADIVSESARAAPPVFVAGLTVLGVSLNDVVLLFTLVYVVLQMGYLLHKWYRVVKRGPHPHDREDDE